MTEKKLVPPALAQFALEQLAESGEQAAIDLTVQNVEILRAEIERRDARIVEQAREIERIESERAEQWRIRRDAVSEIDTKSAIIAELRAGQALEIERIARAYTSELDDLAQRNYNMRFEIAALKAQQPSGVVLPDTKHLKSAIDGLPDSYSKDDVIYGWQEALELVALLNPCRAQAVPALMALREAITPEVIDWLKCGLSTNGRLINGTHPALEKLKDAMLAAAPSAPSAKNESE